MRKFFAAIFALLVVVWAMQDMFIVQRVSPVENWLLRHGFTDVAAVGTEFFVLIALVVGAAVLLGYPRAENEVK